MTRILLALALAATLSAQTEGRPNVVVILLDDLGYSDLGCYGGEIETPHIDRLAENGVRFESFYNSARCCPSRASLMTGLYPPQTGIASFTTREPHPTRGPVLLPGTAATPLRAAMPPLRAPPRPATRRRRMPRSAS